MKLKQIYQAIREAEEAKSAEDEFSTFIDTIEQIEKHARERKVLEPGYSRDDLIDDIKREQPDIDLEKAEKMASFVFKHIDTIEEDSSNYPAFEDEEPRSAAELDEGDPVVITGNVEFKGEIGTIDSFGRDKKFVIVDLNDHGLHSFHSSDVSYSTEESKSEIEEDSSDDVDQEFEFRATSADDSREEFMRWLNNLPDEPEEIEKLDEAEIVSRVSAEEINLHRAAIKQLSQKIDKLNAMYVSAKAAKDTEAMQKIRAAMAKIASAKSELATNLSSRVGESVSESFPYDVDHMHGSVIRNADMITDNVKTTSRAEWDRAVNSINARVFDDMSEFRTDGKGETVTGNSAVWAKWNKETNTGWFNAKGRPLKPWPVKESVSESVDVENLKKNDLVFHTMLGLCRFRYVEGNTAFVQSTRDSKVYRVSVNSLQPANRAEHELAEGFFDRFKKKDTEPNDPRMMSAFHAAGGYDKDLDVMAWQLGWKLSKNNPGVSGDQVFQKLYYGGGSPFPFDQKTFKMAWDAAQDQQVNEFAPGGNFKPPMPPKEKGNDPWGDDNRSQIAQAVKKLLATGNKVDWQVPGQMGHVVSVRDDGVTMKRWGVKRATTHYFLPITADRDSKYQIVLKGPNHYAVKSSGLEDDSLNEMDSEGYTGSRDRKSMSTYGSRDKDTVSNGPDVHLGPDSIVKPKDMVSHLHKSLDRALSREKKASPAQVEKNKARWAQRKAEREQGLAEGLNTTEQKLLDMGHNNKYIYINGRHQHEAAKKLVAKGLAEKYDDNSYYASGGEYYINPFTRKQGLTKGGTKVYGGTLYFKDNSVAEGSIKDVEAKIRAHDQRKTDREQAGDPYVAHELHSHNVIRKQLLDKRKRAQSAYQKKIDAELEEGVAEGNEGTLWRVESSEATGRFYVVKGYNKARKVWKNKTGAGDFNSKESAQSKADELNKGVAEIKI